MDILERFRDKWREVPGGDDVDGRVFADALLELPDEQFLARWDAISLRRAAGVVGRMEPLYRDFFTKSAVLEIGGGLGYDGLRFAAQGATWTFADIVPANLAVIRRVAGLRNLSVHIHLIGDDLSFDGLGQFDAIMAVGSIHHVPFDIARREALNALKHLKVGGRWIELVYPRERWLREGRMPFSTWGTRTDGERTPWVEWHDAEKVRRRLWPAQLQTILDFELASHSHRWLDFSYDGMAPEADLTNFVDLGPLLMEGGTRDTWIYGQSGAFRPICRYDLSSIAMPLPWRVEIGVELQHGMIGVGFIDKQGNFLANSEVVIEASPWVRPLTIRANETAHALTIRNRDEENPSRFRIWSTRLLKDL